MPAPTVRRLTLVAAAAVAVFAAPASPALASGASGCPAAAVSNPFAPWGDPADYQLVRGGDIEDGGASWSLTGGAQAVEGNELFNVTSPSDHLSMRLPGSASATTARMCAGAEHPSFRFFAKRRGGSAAGRLMVSVVYSDASGDEVSLPAGSVSGSDAWAPSPSLPTMVEQIGATQGATVSISFRFQPRGGGVWSVDDLYVDPHRLP